MVGRAASQQFQGHMNKAILEKLYAQHMKWCKYVLVGVGGQEGALRSAEETAREVKAAFVFIAEPSGGPSPRHGVAQALWWRITVNNCAVGCQRHLAWCWAGRARLGPHTQPPMPPEPGPKHSAMKEKRQRERERERERERWRLIHGWRLERMGTWMRQNK